MGLRMYITDSGQYLIEEINLGVPGGNYGWSLREGAFSVMPHDETHLSAKDVDDSYLDPVLSYEREVGSSIAGGFVYRGQNIPDLFGSYVFGDVVNGRLFYVAVETLTFGTQAVPKELIFLNHGHPTTLLKMVSTPPVGLHIAQDHVGEIVLITRQNAKLLQVGQAQNLNPLTDRKTHEKLALDEFSRRTTHFGLAALAIVFGVFIAWLLFTVLRKRGKPSAQSDRIEGGRLGRGGALDGASPVLLRYHRELSHHRGRFGSDNMDHRLSIHSKCLRRGQWNGDTRSWYTSIINLGAGTFRYRAVSLCRS